MQGPKADDLSSRRLPNRRPSSSDSKRRGATMLGYERRKEVVVAAIPGISWLLEFLNLFVLGVGQTLNIQKGGLQAENVSISLEHGGTDNVKHAH